MLAMGTGRSSSNLPIIFVIIATSTVRDTVSKDSQNLGVTGVLYLKSTYRVPIEDGIRAHDHLHCSDGADVELTYQCAAFVTSEPVRLPSAAGSPTANQEFVLLPG